MKRLTLPIAIALALGAGATGAFAQGATEQKGSSLATKSQTGSATTQMHAMSQSKLSAALKQAGFTDVQVVDASYMVHAKTSDGEPIVMVINPPSLSAATGAGTGDSGSGSMDKSSTSTPGATSSGSDASSTTAPSTK
jgi:hypothetical protein